MSNKAVRKSAGQLVGGIGLFIGGSALIGIAQAAGRAELLVLVAVLLGLAGLILGLVGLHQLATNIDYLADREANRHEMEMQAAPR